MEAFEALHAASTSIARLDERLKADPLRAAFRSWFLTQEARGIVYVAGGMLVPEDDLLSMLDPAGAPLMSKALRGAEDIHFALEKSISWGPEAPNPESTLECFAISEGSNPRRSSIGAEGVAENDAIAFRSEIEAHFATRSPETAAETLRRLMNLSGFVGNSRRMALLAAPYLISYGFGAPRAIIPFASILSRSDSERLNEALNDQEKFLKLFLESVARAAARAYDTLVEFGRLSQDAEIRLGKRRASGRHLTMVHLFLGRPVRSIGQLATELDMTVAGAGFVIDSLVKQGLVAPQPSDNQKRRLFTMKKAIGL